MLTLGSRRDLPGRGEAIMFGVELMVLSVLKLMLLTQQVQYEPHGTIVVLLIPRSKLHPTI